MTQAIRILLVEDRDEDAELVLRQLRQAGFQPDYHRVDNEADFVRSLDREFDLVLSDYEMPQFDGMRALKLLQQSGREIPFIIVSGTIGEDTAVAAMKEGATDYLMKDRLGRLGLVVTHALEQSRLRRENGAAAERLKLFRTLVDRSNDTFEVIDPATARFLDVNEKGCTDLGYSREELLSRTVFDIDPAMTESIWAALMEQTRQEGARIVEGLHRRKDGTMFPVEVNIKLVQLDREYLVCVVRDITERQQAEEAQRRSREEFKDLFDNAPIGYHEVDARGRLVRINQTELKMLGYSAEELLGQFVWKISAEEEISHQAVLAKLSGAPPPPAFERIFRRKDGSTFPVLIEDKILKREDGAIIGMRAVVRDITERKQAQKEAARMQARFEFIFGSVPVGITWMEQGNVASRMVNPANERITGVPVGLCHQVDLYRQATHPDDRVRQDELHQRMLAGEIDHYAMEKRYVHGDGVVIWVALTVRSFRDPAGEMTQEITTMMDITERKQAEQSLRESEERFRQIAENITEAFWITDPVKSRMLYISPAYEKIWGRSCQSLYKTPHNWIEAIHPEDRQRIVEAAATKQSRGDYNEIYRITQPDGSTRWIHDRAYPILNKEGRVYRIVGTAEDITTHRKLEEKLRQTQKMEAIGTLAGGIAHDFNNILAAINGYTELARMNLKDNPAIKDYLDSVLQAGKRAADLVRQILTFSRQQEQQRLPVQLGEIVTESLKLLRATIPSTIQFATTEVPNLPAVLADPSQMHQVIMNLGTNAWHAMRDGPGRLEVKLENFVVDAILAETNPRLRPGPYVRLSISDTGCGMSPATLPHVFEPFFTTKPKGEGTGLGLSVVHGIMESHDGVITVYSRPGEGTVFHLYFPVYHGSAPVAAVPTGPVPLGSGKRILYVDDEVALARLGQKTLEQLGYEVETCTKVASALEIVRAAPQRFDLIITDHAMPGMTGLDFAAQLLQIRPGLPIILTTGYSPNLTLERIRALGFRDLLLKPHTLQSLGMAVHRVLAEKAPATAPSKILVIEDDELLRKLLVKNLLLMGYVVTEAGNGKEGMARHQREPVDLVLTDIIMPEQEGNETIREFRRECPTVKIIAMSGGGRASAKSHLQVAKELGAARVLAKPFSYQELADAVSEVLAGEPTRVVSK